MIRMGQRLLILLLLAGCCPSLCAPQTTKAPLNDTLTRALNESNLRDANAKPFHLRTIVAEPGAPDSPYQGVIEEWWFSADNWRREVTDKAGMHQTIVVAAGKKSERDEGDYYPLWLRDYVTGLTVRVPDATTTWAAANLTIDQMTIKSMGMRSDACVRIRSKLGTGDRATDAFTVLCFDGQDRVKSIVSPRYRMNFEDYRAFHGKQISRKLSTFPEPGTSLAGRVETLEDLQSTKATSLLEPLPQNDSRFETIEKSPAQMEKLTAANAPLIWPKIHAGRTRGNLSMYISADAEGHIREAWPLNSDNAGFDDTAREQVRKWTIPAMKDAAGNPVQVDGGIGFLFQTVIEDPLAELTDAQARQLRISGPDPVIPPGVAPAGTRYRMRVGVNEAGQVITGVSGDVEVPGTVKPAGPALIPIMQTVSKWRFKPLVRDGKPTGFFAELVFVVP